MSKSLKTLFASLIVISSWLVIGAVNSNVAYACSYDPGAGLITNQLPNSGDYDCSPSNDPPRNGLYTPYLAVAWGGMKAPSQTVIVYLPVSSGAESATNLTIESACDNDSDRGDPTNDKDPYTTFTSGTPGVTKVSLGNTLHSSLGFYCDQSKTNDADPSSFNLAFRLTVDNSSATKPPVQKINNTNYYVIEIQATAQDKKDGYENLFRVIADNGLVGFSSVDSDYFTNGGGYDYFKTSQLSGFYNRKARNSPNKDFYDRDLDITGNYWGSRLKFAMTCSATDKVKKRLVFYDPDFRDRGDSTLQEDKNNNGQVNDGDKPMYYSMRRALRAPGSASEVVYDVNGNAVTGIPLVLNDDVFELGREVEFDPDYVYEVLAENIYVLNSLQIGLPFPQIFASDVCVSPDPNITANCNLANSSLEAGEVYYPRFTINRGNPDAPDVAVSLSMTINGSTRTKSFTLPKPASGSVRRVVVVDDDPVPVSPSGDKVEFDGSNAGITLSAPGIYTASYTWSWTAGTLSGPPAGQSPCNQTIDVVARPFFVALGGDIISHRSDTLIAGWNQASGDLYTNFAENTAGSSGSWTSGSVFGAGGVDGVASRSRSTSSNPSKVLTFANTSGTWGGSFGNLWTYTAPVAGNIPSGLVGLPGSVAANSGKHVYSGGGTFAGYNVPAGVSLTVYVNGDVRITGNVSYANSNAYGNISNIPRFKLIATGNIYVSSGVGQLDGEYVAGGRVYTCHNDSSWGVPLSVNFYGACNTALVVNGSMIGAAVKLTRTAGTLRQASPASPSGAAEAIYFNPEIFLSSPADPPAIPAGTVYDSITALPPLF